MVAAGKVASPVPWAVAVSGEGELIAGRYRLVSRLGSGAMGVVWLAFDERLGRTVAIKQLVVPAILSDLKTEQATRAMREGRIIARVHHQHVVTVHDVVEHQGQPCLVMEHLPCRSLAAVLSLQGVLAPDIVAGIGSQIASGLAAAHQVGIVHRDIKPGNVLLANDGTAKITDFGVSHAVGDATVTTTGILAGTPAYLAPEVAQGDDGDFRSDVFSLGSTLYTALEGAPPFGLSDNPIALLERVAAGEITPPRQSGPLTSLLLRLLARDPAHRPPMAEVRERLATLAASLAVSPGDTLAASLAVSPGDLSAPTLPLPHADPSFTPVDNAQQMLSASSTPEQTTSPAKRARVDALAAGPPTTGEDAVAGLSGPQQLLVGALTVVMLTASVLATLLVGHDTATTNPATLTNTSQVADSFPGVAQHPGPSDPAPAINSPTPVMSDSPQDTTDQLPKTITDYHAPIPSNPPVAQERLSARSSPGPVGGVTTYWVQSPPRPDQFWASHRGWSGHHRHTHRGH